jgi:predicted AlkP superfamily pyrophosphatase or phosphodiesterase
MVYFNIYLYLKLDFVHTLFFHWNKKGYMMKNNRFFVYINWDGFSYYYYKLANSLSYSGTPYINKLLNEGILFTNAYTGIPSITYPMQSAIVSGAYSDVTNNVYKYFDRHLNKVILCRRLNKAQTIGEVLAGNDICFASIQQFALENRGAEYDDLRHLYIQPGGDYKNRFKWARQIFVNSGISGIEMDEQPKVLFIYIDDLDSIGHNNFYARGRIKRFTEKGRLKNIMGRLKQMDNELGKFVEFLKYIGIYDNTNILLTSDHGMVPFKGKSYVHRIIEILKNQGFHKIECLNIGETSSPDWEVIMISVNLQLQIYFRDQLGDEKMRSIKAMIEQDDIVEKCLTKDELKKRGTAAFFADMLVSPIPPYHFSINKNRYWTLHANHDSLNSQAQHVFSLIKGPDFKKGVVYDKRVYNISFIPTLCTAMELPLPVQSNARIIYDIIV